MIVKILSSSAAFNGVSYNTGKIENGKGELLKAANFGVLEGLSNWRPQDFKNYLKAMSARNKLVTKPQFHAVISAKGRTVDKSNLLEIAEKWLDAMGYGKQPYLVVYHNDTDNNHVHLVTARINWNGRKINDSYEKLRAVKAMSKIMQQDAKTKIQNALGYCFTTLAQFKMILNSKRNGDLYIDIDPASVNFREPAKSRAIQLNAIFRKYAAQYSMEQFTEFLKQKMGIELIFHAKDGKPAYGYTVIDHAKKNAYKGGEIMPLKQLRGLEESKPALQQYQALGPPIQQTQTSQLDDTAIRISISGDVNDESIHGPRRRRKKKARGNQR